MWVRKERGEDGGREGEYRVGEGWRKKEGRLEGKGKSGGEGGRGEGEEERERGRRQHCGGGPKGEREGEREGRERGGGEQVAAIRVLSIDSSEASLLRTRSSEAIQKAGEVGPEYVWGFRADEEVIYKP